MDMQFTEAASGGNKDREKLRECLDYVRAGDTLFVHSIDRLARNLSDLQDIINKFVSKGVTVKFYKENLTFTGKDDPISVMTLQIMGAFAEFERSLIRSRQREGIDAARKQGKHLGRPPKITKEQIQTAKQLFAEKVSIRQIAIKMGVCRATIYKMLRSPD
jgi:DNA invertase Pin-like site-specific DNA recombinase